jgi:hypothetical protein
MIQSQNIFNQFGHDAGENLIDAVLVALEEIPVFNPALFRFAETQPPERRAALANDLFQRLRADEQRRVVWETLGINPASLAKTAEGVARWMN